MSKSLQSLQSALNVVIEQRDEPAALQEALEQHYPWALRTDDFVKQAAAALALAFALDLYDINLSEAELAYGSINLAKFLRLSNEQQGDVQAEVREVLVDVFDAKVLERSLGWR